MICLVSALLYRNKKDLDKTRIKYDSNAVLDVMELVNTTINPFDNDYESLVHLTSGSVASGDVESDMNNMYERGEAAAVTYMEKNILSEKPDIYAPLQKMNLRTFSSMNKKVASKTKKGEIVALKNSKNLFAKMLLIAKTRDLNMENVLKYSLRPFPLPFATAEGNLVKTAKSKLLNIIENETQDAQIESVDGQCALILDAMAILQSTKITCHTFGELAHELLVKIVKMAICARSKRVDFVGDQYPIHSIKNLEREKRSEGGAFTVKVYGEQQRVPRQWKKFLANGKNKEELLKFIFECWKKSSPQLLRGVEVFITHGQDCSMLKESPNGIDCCDVEELTCDHEEADTRMVSQ